MDKYELIHEILSKKIDVPIGFIFYDPLIKETRFVDIGAVYTGVVNCKALGGTKYADVLTDKSEPTNEDEHLIIYLDKS